VDRTELHKVALNELVVQSLTERRGTAFDNNTGSLESLDLGVGIALSATDDGT
jgi:hypothetical protein